MDTPKMNSPQISSPQMSSQGMMPTDSPPSPRFKILLIVLIVVVVGAFAFVSWQYFSHWITQTYQLSTSVQVVVPPAKGFPELSSGDTTADIANDLGQTSDDTAVTNEMNTLDQNMNNF